MEYLILDEGELVDTYGGDYTYRDIAYCIESNSFLIRYYGADEQDWHDAPSEMAEDLRSQYYAKIQSELGDGNIYGGNLNV